MYGQTLIVVHLAHEIEDRPSDHERPLCHHEPHVHVADGYAVILRWRRVLCTVPSELLAGVPHPIADTLVQANGHEPTSRSTGRLGAYS